MKLLDSRFILQIVKDLVASPPGHLPMFFLRVLLMQRYLKLGAQFPIAGLGLDSGRNDRTELIIFPHNDLGGYMHVYAPRDLRVYKYILLFTI